MEKESSKMQPESVWPLLPYECLSSFHATPLGECNSSVDCNTEFDKLVKENNFLDSYTATNRENNHIFHSVDQKANVSDHLNFNVRPLQPYIDEKESNNGKSEQLVRPMLPSQCLTSFHATPRDFSVNRNTKEILVQRKYGNDILKDVIVKEDEVLNPFTAKIANYFVNISKYINPSVKGKANVFDDSNFTEDSHSHSIPQSTYFERFRHEMQPQVKDPTVMDVVNNLSLQEGNITGIDVQTNQMPLVKEDEYLTSVCSTRSLLQRNDAMESTVCLQDIPKETTDCESYDDHNRKTTDEIDDASGSNNKDNFEIVNIHNKCKLESIQNIDIQSGTLHVHNDKNSTFKMKHSLQNQKRIHKGVEPYECEKCKKKFKKKDTLRYHSYIHTGEKPFVCNMCQARFRRRSALLSHSYTHSGNKTYVCNVCQKTFVQSATLRSHSYTHTGEKPFVCNVCQKAFAQYTTLRNHSYIHTGERPHVCKVCGKSFAQKASLMNHSKLHIDKNLHQPEVLTQ